MHGIRDYNSPCMPTLRARAIPPLVALPVAFNLFVLRSERLAVHNLNDTSVHAAMVRWATQRIRDGHLPFDGWFPLLSGGLGQFHVYQSLPHSIAGLLGVVFGPGATVRWILYLGLALWPLGVYFAARLFELDRWVAASAAVISPLLVSAPGYGYEHGSYTWQGLGVWSQLWGMWLLPITAALCWRAVRRGRGYTAAAVTLGLTFACHFLTGYLAMVVLGAWVLITPSEFVARLRRALLLGASSLSVVAWVVVPLLRDAPYAAQTAFNRHTFWNDSFGAAKILGWLFRGELFDYGRWPVVSVLVAIGVAVCIAGRRDERCRALLAFTGVSLVLFFGRATFGSFTRVLPGGDDLIMHRFIMGVHAGGVLLAGTGAAWLGRRAWAAARSAGVAFARAGATNPALALSGALVFVLVPAGLAVGRYDQRDNGYIAQQRLTDATDGADFNALARRAHASGDGLVYAGMTNNWAHDEHRLGSVPLYTELLNDDVDAIGFTLRTQSLLSDVEVYFDETNPAHYELFNVAYAVLPRTRTQPPGSALVEARGEFRLYRVPTSGYLARIATVDPPVASDRRTMSEGPGNFVRTLSAGVVDALPLVAFDGHDAGPATAATEGRLSARRTDPANGVFRATTSGGRSVVVLKQAFSPRWRVRVDGKAAERVMVAPAFVGVTVPAGRHTVEFRYEPVGSYWLLFALSAATIAALVVLDRRARQAG